MLAGVIKVQIFLPPKQGRKDPHVPKLAERARATNPVRYMEPLRENERISCDFQSPGRKENQPPQSSAAV
jgi:hypothetical protein